MDEEEPQTRMWPTSSFRGLLHPERAALGLLICPPLGPQLQSDDCGGCYRPGVLSTLKVLVRAEMEWLGAESNTCLVDFSGK